MRISLFIFLSCLFFTSIAHAANRVALVVGNSNYQQGYLKNPSNDASDISNALQQLGFDVDLVKNTSRKSLLNAVQNFRRKLNSSTEVAFFYYSGHGAQFEGESYLLPLQANIASAADLPVEALPAKNVLIQMRTSGSQVNVMVLDACRDLPFAQLSRSSNRGLSRIEASDSALIAYSTSPGKIAADGNGRNSPYTSALLRLLPKRNLTLTQLFNDVGMAVKKLTGGKQIPWMSSSPMSKIYLANGGAYKQDIKEDNSYWNSDVVVSVTQTKNDESSGSSNSQEGQIGACHSHTGNASRGVTTHCHPHPQGGNHSHIYDGR